MKTLWDKIVEFDTPQQQLWRSAKRHSSSASENSDMAEMKRLSDVEWIDILCESSLFLSPLCFSFFPLSSPFPLNLVAAKSKSHLLKKSNLVCSSI